MRGANEDTVATDLRSLLGPDSSLLPFAKAIVTQVAGHAASERSRAEVAGQAARVLRGAASAHRVCALEALVKDPTLLASFFQNADLLDTTVSEGAAVAELVMEALARVWEEPD
ncbi:MAG: hypothetical protein GEU90_14085 [Gemmatimonas sp.]|nr:hypothetical protein [Gemmatimonas sp.]